VDGACVEGHVIAEDQQAAERPPVWCRLWGLAILPARSCLARCWLCHRARLLAVFRPLRTLICSVQAVLQESQEICVVDVVHYQLEPPLLIRRKARPCCLRSLVLVTVLLCACMRNVQRRMIL